jgi:DNA polymerase-2
MATRRLEGWLFDVDELGPQVALWVYTTAGHLLRLTDEFRPPIYVQGERAKLKRLASELERRGIISHVRWAEQREFWNGALIDVLEMHVADSSLMSRLRTFAATRDREFTFYNCDIPAAQHYLYLKKLFPLCRLACDIDNAGNVLEIDATDSLSETDYQLPDLRIMKMWGERMRPLNEHSCIHLECAGKSVRLKLADGARAIEAFNSFIECLDPDVILSERGDTVLMPALLSLVKREKIALMVDRDRVVTQRKIETEGRTYFSYGRIIYKGPSYPFFGRWHIDGNNSFIHRETALDGLIELARLARVPVQRMARTSPGSAMTSMQMDRAIADDILVPWHKSEPEAYKTALELLTVDKGGLTFQPKLGAFERVAEIDYASMYPAIMVQHNISPETVLCSCCQNSAVPEAGYNICEKRRGLIPRTLAPLLERRKRYKQLLRAGDKEGDRYNERQTAIKWMLVSCFGYLGYKNARFGRIEAHEAVTAFGRDKLLRAKELAEARGYRMLHALTDSLWLKREEVNEADLLALCDEITQATQVEMSLEGIYKWIVFLPSKVNDARPVACRYYGVFADGKLKLRGLACRRSDTPPFIKEVQWELLAIIAKAVTLAEWLRMIEQAKVILQQRIGELERGEIDPARLLLKRTLTKELDAYTVETRTALAARQLEGAGVKVHPGERVRYVVKEAKAKDKSRRVHAEGIEPLPDYDAAEYVKLLLAAAVEILGV